MYNFAKLFSLSQHQTFALYYSHIYREWRTKIRIYRKQNTVMWRFRKWNHLPRRFRRFRETSFRFDKSIA